MPPWNSLYSISRAVIGLYRSNKGGRTGRSEAVCNPITFVNCFFVTTMYADLRGDYKLGTICVYVWSRFFYRRRSMFRRLYSDGSKSIPSLPSLPAAPSTTSPRTMFSRQPRPENGSERPNPFLSHFLTASKASSNDMEMTEDCRHVYSNPNYPMHERGPSGLNGLNDFNGFNNTMQIGGLPFYLPPQNSTKPINQLVESSAEAASAGFGKLAIFYKTFAIERRNELCQ